jgi:hypothetical protein
MNTPGDFGSNLPVWIQAISSIILAIIAFIAIFQDRIRNLITKPKLDIKVDTTSPDCVKTPLKYKKGVKQFDSEGYYIRIRILNTGNYQANNVEVFMSELQKKQADGSYKKLDTFLPMNLTWTNINNIYFPAISPEMYKHCDLCHIFNPADRKNIQYEEPDWIEGDRKKVVISFSTMVRPLSLSHLAPFGNYRIILIIAASNAKPLKKIIELNVSGQWFDDERKMFSDGIGVNIFK